MLVQGKSEAEIKQYFVEHFGPQVLNEPPNRLVVYAIPALAFLLGAFLLWRGFKGWLKPSQAGAGVPTREAKPVVQDEYVKKLEDELKKRK